MVEFARQRVHPLCLISSTAEVNSGYEFGGGSSSLARGRSTRDSRCNLADDADTKSVKAADG